MSEYVLDVLVFESEELDDGMSELLPCPFCGGEASKRLFYKGKYRVHCNVCDAHSGDVCDTEAEAIAAWNSRAERTCENVGYYIDSTRFKCSECGYNGWTKWAEDGEDKIPSYCPNCGAKVVGE